MSGPEHSSGQRLMLRLSLACVVGAAVTLGGCTAPSSAGPFGTESPSASVPVTPPASAAVPPSASTPVTPLPSGAASPSAIASALAAASPTAQPSPWLPEGASLRAIKPGDLPADGSPTVASVVLPTGHRVTPDPAFTSRPVSGPVMWVTDAPVDGASRLWLTLAQAFPHTGLWPVLLPTAQTRAGVIDLFRYDALDPSVMGDPSVVDVRSALATFWKDAVDSGGGALAPIEPYGARFPGLGRATTGSAATGQLPAAIDALRGRLALVPVTRPADVPVVIGWTGPANWYSDLAPLSAVMRSWEDRYDAMIIALSSDVMVVFAARPPIDFDTALAVAAEHFAVCPDLVYQGSSNLRELARALVGQPVWSFWWD